MNKQRCALILDRYPSHASEKVIEIAEELKIELVFIPTSATDKFQPLDIRIFGILKSMAAKEFNDHVFAHNTGYTKAEAADLFLKCWQRLSHESVIAAWTINEEDDEEDASEHESDDDFVQYDSDYSTEEEAEFEEKNRRRRVKNVKKRGRT